MKLLFVKLGAIGDAAMALSILPAIEATYPGARLSWICGRGIEPLLRLFPQIHELIVVNDRALLGGSRWAALHELLAVQRRLLGRRFDLVLHGNADWRYHLLTATLWSTESRTWSRKAGRPWPIPGRYHGDEYARLVTGGTEGETRSWVPPALAPGLSASLRAELGEGGRLIALTPGGAKNTLADDFRRRWPVENYALLAKELVAKGHRVMLTGAASDAWVLPVFAGIPHVNLIGQTSLVDLLALYAAAAVVVSHDTSSVHLSRLVGTPVVALFGPTIPTEKIPDWARGRVLWGGAYLACRPCYDGRHYGQCGQNECMRSISVGAVLGALQELESNGGA